MHQYSKATLTRERVSIQRAPGQPALLRLTPVLTALSCRVLSPKWLGFEHPGGCVGPWAGSRALFALSVGTWLLNWWFLEHMLKGVAVEMMGDSSLGMFTYLLSSYSSLSLSQPHLLIKLDSLEVKIFVHMCICVLLSKLFRICWWIQLHLARARGLEVLNCWMHGE